MSIKVVLAMANFIQLIKSSYTSSKHQLWQAIVLLATLLNTVLVLIDGVWALVGSLLAVTVSVLVIAGEFNGHRRLEFVYPCLAIILIAVITIAAWFKLHPTVILDNGHENETFTVVFEPGGSWTLLPKTRQTLYPVAHTHRTVKITRDSETVYTNDTTFLAHYIHTLAVDGPACYLVQGQFVDFDEFPPPLTVAYGRWIRSAHGSGKRLSSCSFGL